MSRAIDHPRKWIVARPRTTWLRTAPYLAGGCFFALGAVVTPQDVAVPIVFAAAGFGFAAAFVLRSSAFVRRGMVRSGLGRTWITVRSPEDVVVVAQPPFGVNKICVKVNGSDRTLLVCAPSPFAPRSGSHKAEMDGTRDRIVKQLNLEPQAVVS